MFCFYPSLQPKDHVSFCDIYIKRSFISFSQVLVGKGPYLMRNPRMNVIGLLLTYLIEIYYLYNKLSFRHAFLFLLPFSHS